MASADRREQAVFGGILNRFLIDDLPIDMQARFFFPDRQDDQTRKFIEQVTAKARIPSGVRQGEDNDLSRRLFDGAEQFENLEVVRGNDFDIALTLKKNPQGIAEHSRLVGQYYLDFIHAPLPGHFEWASIFRTGIKHNNGPTGLKSTYRGPTGPEPVWTGLDRPPHEIPEENDTHL